MQMTNDELFGKYDTELKLRIHNPKNLELGRSLLAKFKDHLGQYPPSPDLAKSFIATYIDRAPRTVLRYAASLKTFMKWYGEPMDDLKLRAPQELPAYVEDSDIEKLLTAIRNKRGYKWIIERDTLMVELILNTGLRRSELANLEPRNIHDDFLIVRKGKGQKDRKIPLLPDIAQRLHRFIENKEIDEKVFGLTGPSISNKIKIYALKAGLKNFHTHMLRHKYATDLLEGGVPLPKGPPGGPVIIISPIFRAGTILSLLTRYRL
ncbi:tyrosine-type recombinase/integrase [Chloroflexota bacterium]